MARKVAEFAANRRVTSARFYDMKGEVGALAQALESCDPLAFDHFDCIQPLVSSAGCMRALFFHLEAASEMARRGQEAAGGLSDAAGAIADQIEKNARTLSGFLDKRRELEAR